MREIKFRGYGKDDHGKHWIYGNLLDEKLIGLVAIQDEKCHVWEVDPESVGQYTGLRDVDGRKMYEGDIVRIDDWSSPSYIRWDDDTASFVVDRWAANLAHVYYRKVIGNVYDNPELLERKP